MVSIPSMKSSRWRASMAPSSAPSISAGRTGKTGDLKCAEMVGALTRFRCSCQIHRKTAGMHLVHPDPANIQAALSDGYALIALGLDNVFLAAGARSGIDTAR